MSDDTPLPDNHDPATEAQHRAWKRAAELKGLSMHGGVYLIVILGLFLINAAGGGPWWFFYPAIAWGVALAIHAWSVMSEQVFGASWVERQTAQPKRIEPHDVSGKVSPAGDVVDESVVEIDRMRRSARRIPNQEVRQQALALCASADQVLTVLEETPNEAALADEFLERYLRPANAILGDYSRLANRNISSARPTLEKVESHDIPLLASRLDELYERLHRGNLIDLEVAREMLSLDIAEWDDTSVRPTANRDADITPRVKLE